ncbi:NAD(P)H-binding protein [Bavariicoccus seileri]|uniref:NAD(P)H-binding protein n=1 Tax=Bavariicoccus seileri TaxID=549685 RepID=UPI003F8EF6F5
MKIFVVGASGRVGRQLVKALSKEDHIIYAGSRHPSEESLGNNVIYKKLDLHDSSEAIAETIGDVDVIYFVAGSRGKDLLQTDLYGAIKVMKIAEKIGVKRYIQLSAIFALKTDLWPELIPESLTDYYIAKLFADRYLIDHTELPYTIVQPGELMERPGTGKIAVDVTDQGQIAIDDVAILLQKLLDHKNTIYSVISLHEGPTPIDDALHKV